jgi:hypothetical protein
VLALVSVAEAGNLDSHPLGENEGCWYCCWELGVRKDWVRLIEPPSPGPGRCCVPAIGVEGGESNRMVEFERRVSNAVSVDDWRRPSDATSWRSSSPKRIEEKMMLSARTSILLLLKATFAR